MQIILKKPVISEKSMKLADHNLYTFIVAKNITKPEIAKIVEEKFGVDVESVKTFIVKGKQKLKRSKRGYLGLRKTSSFKKAIVKVKKGQKIGLFVTQKEEKETKDVKDEKKTAEIKEKKSLLKGTKVKIEKIKEEKLKEKKGEK